MIQHSSASDKATKTGFSTRTVAQPVHESLIRNDRQTYFEVVRDLVHAQYRLGDEQLTQRLWDDVIERKLDIERVVNLMFTCSMHHNDEAMTRVDEEYCQNNYQAETT